MATVIERLREICPQPGRGKIFIWEQVQFVYTHLPALLALADAVKVMMDPSRPLDKAEEDGAAVEKALADLEKEAP